MRRVFGRSQPCAIFTRAVGRKFFWQLSQGWQCLHSIRAVKQAPMTVSAAISLKDALDQLGREYERDNPGAKVTFNYGASGDIAAPD